MTEPHPHWVWDHMPKQCEFLLIKGMSIHCLDSFSPSRCECDHHISPLCWDLSSHSSAKESSDKVLEDIIKLVEQIRETAIGMLDTNIPATWKPETAKHFRQECMNDIDRMVRRITELHTKER